MKNIEEFEMFLLENAETGDRPYTKDQLNRIVALMKEDANDNSPDSEFTNTPSSTRFDI
jgi:hypothetical protein